MDDRVDLADEGLSISEEELSWGMDDSGEHIKSGVESS